MEVYFDESGNTGCIMSKNGLLNFSSQPVFVLGSVITSGEEDKKELMDKYQRFKTEFNIDGEIKGSELMTRRRNKELEYLLDNVFDNTHFYVNIYNKRFYICTLLLLSLIGQEFRDTMPVCFYQQASMLAFQDDKFFVEYFNYISNPTEERFHNYLSFLNCFSYLDISDDSNVVKIASSSLLQNNDEKLFFDDFMTYGWYKDKDIVNLINLNALSELITLLKSKNEFSNSSTKYIHDHISEFEATFKTELCEYDVDLSFEDSKDSLLLQLVDNFTSIVAHSYNRMISNLRHNKQWLQSSEWDMLLVSRLFRLVSTDNIKLTVPLSDFSATLCLMDMFAPDYYPINRNNCCFDYLYNIKMRYIIDNIRYYSLFNSIIDSILKK